MIGHPQVAPRRAIESRLVVVPLMEESEAAAGVTAEERAEAQRMGSVRRRREWLTWRALVRRELGAGVRIAYDEVGAPVVAGCEAHISVAHCPGRVALCISPNRCAVDIEPETRDCSRAADRFMSPGERTLSEDPLLPLVVWCTKETLYKYAGRKGLDLLRDLRVEQVDLDGGTVRARIANAEPIHLGIHREEGFLAVCIFS